MLTVLGWFVPSIKEARYTMLAEYCIERSKYYCKLEDGLQALYWSTEASKYLTKVFKLHTKKRG